MAHAHTFALFWSQCLSDSVRGVSWDLTLTNLFLVIVRFAIMIKYDGKRYPSQFVSEMLDSL